MLQTINNWKTRVLIIAVMLLTVATGTLMVPPTASAAGCRKTDVGMNNGYFTNQWAEFKYDGSVGRWYTDWIKSPSWATSCRDVNIANVYVPGDAGYQCVDFWAVRKWDNKASDPVTICRGSSWRVVFSGIYGNTYRVEARPQANPNYRPYYTIMD